MVKNLPAIRETWVQSLGWENPLENGIATHWYSCLENPMDRSDSPRGGKESDVTERLTLSHFNRITVINPVCSRPSDLAGDPWATVAELGVSDVSPFLPEMF